MYDVTTYVRVVSFDRRNDEIPRMFSRWQEGNNGNKQKKTPRDQNLLPDFQSHAPETCCTFSSIARSCDRHRIYTTQSDHGCVHACIGIYYDQRSSIDDTMSDCHRVPPAPMFVTCGGLLLLCDSATTTLYISGAHAIFRRARIEFHSADGSRERSPSYWRRLRVYVILLEMTEIFVFTNEKRHKKKNTKSLKIVTKRRPRGPCVSASRVAQQMVHNQPTRARFPYTRRNIGILLIYAY